MTLVSGYSIATIFMWKNNMSFGEAADLIERFVDHKSSYPQEWNDFVDTRQQSQDVDVYRRRCYTLDPLVNSPHPVHAEAGGELRLMIQELRSREKTG